MPKQSQGQGLCILRAGEIDKIDLCSEGRIEVQLLPHVVTTVADTTSSYCSTCTASCTFVKYLEYPPLLALEFKAALSCHDCFSPELVFPGFPNLLLATCTPPDTKLMAYEHSRCMLP